MHLRAGGNIAADGLEQMDACRLLLHTNQAQHAAHIIAQAIQCAGKAGIILGALHQLGQQAHCAKEQRQHQHHGDDHRQPAAAAGSLVLILIIIVAFGIEPRIQLRIAGLILPAAAIIGRALALLAIYARAGLRLGILRRAVENRLLPRLIGAGIPRGRGRTRAAAQGGHHPGGLRIGILRRGLVFAFALNILIQLLMPVHAAMARGGVGGILIRPGFGIKMISHAAYSL